MHGGDFDRTTAGVYIEKKLVNIFLIYLYKNMLKTDLKNRDFLKYDSLITQICCLLYFVTVIFTIFTLFPNMKSF